MELITALDKVVYKENRPFLVLCRVFLTLLGIVCACKEEPSMDQQKIGRFLKELRKEKNLTQEQLAEILNVSGRSVSRWETGNNMPDLSVLVELSEFYNVDIKEIIDGERESENMNIEEKETIEKIVEYAETEKHQKAGKLNKYFVLGLTCIVIVLLNRQFEILSYVFRENIDEFVSGMLCGLGLLFEFIGFYNNNHDVAFKERKKAFINSVMKKN